MCIGLLVWFSLSHTHTEQANQFPLGIPFGSVRVKRDLITDSLHKLAALLDAKSAEYRHVISSDLLSKNCDPEQHVMIIKFITVYW